MQKWDGGVLTLQLAVQLLLLLLQPPDPLLKRLYLLTSCSTLLRLPQADCCPTDRTAVSEAASSGEGEAHEREVLTGEASVRRGRADVLQGETEGQTPQTGCSWEHWDSNWTFGLTGFLRTSSSTSKLDVSVGEETSGM